MLSELSAKELPPVYQAELDPEVYEALFRDYQCLEGPVAIHAKREERGYVQEDETWTLEAARVALESGAVRAIQLRYTHDGQAWFDTLLRAGSGFRLVRMAAPSAP